MNHANMYAVGLALCTFADIASEEMSRDLANEIEKLLGSSNTYIRKKVRQPGNTSLHSPYALLRRRLLYVHSALSGKCPTFPTTLSPKPRTSSPIVIMVYSLLPSP